MVKERRAFQRIVETLLVDVGVSNDRFFYDYTKNFSPTGIWIESKESIDVGQPLVLRFTLPKIDHIFEARGSVVWKGALEDGEGFGLRIDSMDATDTEKLNAYCLGKAESAT